MRTRILFTCMLLFLFQSLEAQNKFVDSLYSVKKPVTKVYAEKDGEQLIVDIYQPENSDQSRPAIIFMHGGGFAGGSPKNPQEVKFAKTAAAKGYTVGLISYRLVRKGTETGFGCDFDADGKLETFRKAAVDFMDAAAFIKNHAKDLQVDPEKIIAGGSSAGAEAVLNAVYNPDLMFEDKKYADIKFSAVMSLAGAIVDARYIDSENAVPGIFFHGTDDNLVPYTTAPHHYCEKSTPGYLMLDGSKTIVEKLKELNTSYLFYSFEGARHEISGMPFEHMPRIFQFLKEVVFENNKIQSTLFK